MRLSAALGAAVALVLLCAAPAAAAPPPNDGPATASVFEPYTAENGDPGELQAIAELVEAQPDPGVPRCLGPRSFQRTVWYRVPAAAAPRELAVEASGRTLAPVDLAAFVQPAAEGAPLTARPNACAGAGAGGSDVAADSTSSATLRVPAGLAVLLQVGRRGTTGSPDDERALLSLSDTPLPGEPSPAGDVADRRTPRIARTGVAQVPRGGAPTPGEAPAAPACPALAGVWRRVRPRATGVWTIRATGPHVAALSAFAGRRPDSRRFRGCVDRDGPGSLVLPVRARRRQWLWIRVGTDRPPPGAGAQLRFARAARGDEESGGGCLASARPLVRGGLAGASTVRARNRERALVVSLSARAGPVCAARLELVGPRGRVYARGQAETIDRTPQLVRLRRVRRLVRGRYRLRIEAAGLGGIRVNVRSRVAFNLG